MPVIQKTKYECFSRIVISSEVEKSSLQTDDWRVFENRNRQRQVRFLKETLLHSYFRASPYKYSRRSRRLHS